MSIKVGQAFERTSAQPIDASIALTKAQMVAVNDNLMPAYYFTICQDDGKLYLYDKSATASATTGKFTEFSGGGSSDGTYFSSTKLNTTITRTKAIAKTDVTGLVPGNIVLGETQIYDADGSVGIVTSYADPTLTVTTITTAGAGGGSYNVNSNGDRLKSAYAKLDSSWNPSNGATVPLVKKSGDFEQPSVGLFTVPDGMRVEAIFSTSQRPRGDISFSLYNNTDGVALPDIANIDPFIGEQYLNGTVLAAQWTNDTGHAVNLSVRVDSVSVAGTLLAYTHFTLKEISRVVDPIKYLDNSKGLQDTPVGNIISYMGNNVPRHYLACDGTIYNIGDYPALEAHFIEEFGKVNYFGGNGTTTWAVPDLQGEFLRGTGKNSHTNQGNGANVGVHQDGTEMPYMQGSSGNLGGRTKDSNTSHEVVTEYKNVDSELGAPGNLKYASGFTNNVSNVTPDFTSRPTNTSVKYCIKYESTMQVILGNEQYKEKATLSYTLTKNTMAFPTLTHVDGDSMIGSGYTAGQNNAFVAPVDGWYSVSFYIPETADVSKMTYHACYLYKNGTVVGGQERDDNSTDLRVPMNCTTTIRLKKGDKVAWAWYWGGTFTDTYTRTGEANFVLLTSSVDINEVNIIAADDVYSTDEQLVGSYLGKPMYKKTFDAVLNASGKRTISELPSTIDKFVKITGTCIDTAGWTIPVGTQQQTGLEQQYLSIVGGFSPANALWFSYGSYLNGQTAKVTCYYTKTTDTAGSAPNKNSLLLTRPDLWTPGTEYDFGGGLYGKRITGNVTLVSGTRQDIVVASGISSSGKIISQGGSINTSQNWKCPVPWSYANHASAGGTYFEAAVHTRTSDHCLYIYTDVTPGATSYDVWCTYTK